MSSQEHMLWLSRKDLLPQSQCDLLPPDEAIPRYIQAHTLPPLPDTLVDGAALQPWTLTPDALPTGSLARATIQSQMRALRHLAAGPHFRDLCSRIGSNPAPDRFGKSAPRPGPSSLSCHPHSHHLLSAVSTQTHVRRLTQLWA